MCYKSPSAWPDEGTSRTADGAGWRRSDRALGLNLAFAVNVALAARYQTGTILTLDRRDFRTVRPLTGHLAFRLLPDDR